MGKKNFLGGRKSESWAKFRKGFAPFTKSSSDLTTVFFDGNTFFLLF